MCLTLENSIDRHGNLVCAHKRRRKICFKRRWRRQRRRKYVEIINELTHYRWMAAKMMQRCIVPIDELWIQFQLLTCKFVIDFFRWFRLLSASFIAKSLSISFTPFRFRHSGSSLKHGCHKIFNNFPMLSIKRNILFLLFSLSWFRSFVEMRHQMLIFSVGPK